MIIKTLISLLWVVLFGVVCVCCLWVLFDLVFAWVLCLFCLHCCLALWFVCGLFIVLCGFGRFPGVLVEVGVVVGGLCDSVCGFWVWLHSLGCRFLVALNELLVAGFWLWFTVVLLWLLSFGVVIVDYGCLFVLWVVVLW